MCQHATFHGYRREKYIIQIHIYIYTYIHNTKIHIFLIADSHGAAVPCYTFRKLPSS